MLRLHGGLAHTRASVLAREAVALSDLSGGRFELGLGAGYARREYDCAGIAYDRASVRIERLDEATQIIRRLVPGQTVTFSGHHFRTQTIPSASSRVTYRFSSEATAQVSTP